MLDNELKQILLKCETDINGALGRLSNDEILYSYCLEEFIADQTMNELDFALKEKNWNEAFTAAHALKGLCGNMGFTPLYHAAAEMVIVIRQARIDQIDETYKQLKNIYNTITDALIKYYSEKNDNRG